MKLLYKFFLLSLLTISINSYSQEEIEPLTPIMVEIIPITSTGTPLTATIKIRYINPPQFPVSAWTRKNTVGLDLTEIAFVNWSAGGTSSISGLFKGNFTRIYSTEKSKWVSELIVKYGINKQDGQAVRKSDDEFRINSTY